MKTQELKAAASTTDLVVPVLEEGTETVLTVAQAVALDKLDTPSFTKTQLLDQKRREAREAANNPRNSIPDNKFFTMYQEELGYALSDFFSQDREEAKAEAVRLKTEEGKLSAYAPMKNGWFGVFVKDNDGRPAKAASLEKKVALLIEAGDTELEKLWSQVLAKVAKSETAE